MKSLVDLVAIAKAGTATSSYRYIVVGLVNNGVLYAAYLLGTGLGAAPVAMATVCFVFGVSTSYVLNKTWSFRSVSLHKSAIPKFISSYIVAYCLQIALLYTLYQYIGIMHQIAQLIAAVIVAVYLFTIMRLWVFKT